MTLHRFDPTDFTTTVLPLGDGRDLAFIEVGDPAGVPVFGFHGTPGSRFQLAPVDADARAAGVRLVLPDRPGYGHSSYARRRRLTDWSDDVAAIAAHLDIARFGVLGVSGGGPHALACAAASDRVVAASLVSSPSPPGSVPMLRRSVPIAVAVVAMLALALVALARRFPVELLRLARRSMPPADRAIVDDPEYRRWFLAAARHTPFSIARAAAQDVAVFGRDWGFDPAAVTAPVTVWHGTADRIVEHDHAVALHRTIARSALHSLKGEGHLMFVTRAPEIFAALAQQMAALDGSAAAGYRPRAASSPRT